MSRCRSRNSVSTPSIWGWRWSFGSHRVILVRSSGRWTTPKCRLRLPRSLGVRVGVIIESRHPESVDRNDYEKRNNREKSKVLTGGFLFICDLLTYTFSFCKGLPRVLRQTYDTRNVPRFPEFDGTYGKSLESHTFIHDPPLIQRYPTSFVLQHVPTD